MRNVADVLHEYFEERTPRRRAARRVRATGSATAPCSSDSGSSSSTWTSTRRTLIAACLERRSAGLVEARSVRRTRRDGSCGAGACGSMSPWDAGRRLVITRADIVERVAEWGLTEEVVEKDYVLGWLLWGIGTDPVLVERGSSRAGRASRSATSRPTASPRTSTSPSSPVVRSDPRRSSRSSPDAAAGARRSRASTSRRTAQAAPAAQWAVHRGPGVLHRPAPDARCRPG